MFLFNTDKHNFWPIYESIKKFYPIGIPKDNTPMFYAYPGMKALEEILNENMNEYKTRWEDFLLTIPRDTVSTTYGQAPSFSAYITLEKRVHSDLSRIKEVHFFVSLIGPFYTIIGQDRNEIKVGERTLRSTNFITVSPENEYTDDFNLLSNLIEERFRGYRFVPFYIYKQSIEGPDVIFNTLFNDQIDLSARRTGIDYYKSDNWIKEDYVDNGEKWTSYPPL